MNISELLAQKDKLPNVPEVVKELIQVLSDDKADLDLIATKVARDPTLSVKILRMVNSSYYGLPRKVNSIDEAIVRIGFERLKILVISSGLSGSVTGEVEGLDVKRFWNESFETGEICKIIAKKTKIVEPDVAFTAGIISNIGRLLLHLTTPNRAKAVQTMVDEGANRNQAELDRFQFTSPEAGAALLEEWKLPTELCVAVLQQRAPLDHPEPSSLAAIICLAQQMMAAHKKGATATEIVDGVSFPLLNLAGVKEGLGDIADQVVNLEPMKIV